MLASNHRKVMLDVGISVVIPKNSVNTTEKSSLMMEYRLYAGVSSDPEITDG